MWLGGSDSTLSFLPGVLVDDLVSGMWLGDSGSTLSFLPGVLVDNLVSGMERINWRFTRVSVL